MAGKIICGKTHSAKIINALSQKAHLSVLLVGDDPASKTYIKHKKIACEKAGFGFTAYALPKTATENEVIAKVKDINNSATNGIIVQQPLPAHINKNAVVDAIDPSKDVDCLHHKNLGLLTQGREFFLPCTPAGIVHLLKEEGIEIAGKHAVIVGRSDIVGKPLAFMLLKENATVTICHSKTKNLQEICRQADILIAAIGKAKFITAAYIKDGAVVIDVGINRQDGKLCGDVDFEDVLGKVSHITPVPGGVGPMTVAMLLWNCGKAADGKLVI